MRLLDVSKLLEMAGPAQTCGNCGASPIHKTHNYSKDANGGTRWACRGANVQAFQAAGGKPTPDPATGRYFFVPATGTTPAVTTPAAAPTAGPASSATPAAPKAAVPKAAPKPAATPAPAPSSPARPFRKQAEEWLKSKKVENFTFNADDSVDVDDDVTFAALRYTTLPIKFGKVAGNFSVVGSALTSFKNFPDRVDGSLYVSASPITHLDGCTTSIGEDFTLKDMKELESMASAKPIEVGEDFKLSAPLLSSLPGINKYIKRVGGRVTIEMELKSHALGLMAIRGVKEVQLQYQNRAVSDIMNKHLKSEDRDINAAQEEMIDAGFTALAKM
jgi:hypothetical protein